LIRYAKARDDVFRCYFAFDYAFRFDAMPRDATLPLMARHYAMMLRYFFAAILALLRYAAADIYMLCCQRRYDAATRCFAPLLATPLSMLRHTSHYIDTLIEYQSLISLDNE